MPKRTIGPDTPGVKALEMRKVLHLVRHGQAIHKYVCVHDMSPLQFDSSLFILLPSMCSVRAEVARQRGCSFEEFIQLMHEDDATDADLTEVGRQQVRLALVLGGNRHWCWVLVLGGSRQVILINVSIRFPSI